jgi:hypothetical protein
MSKEGINLLILSCVIARNLCLRGICLLSATFAILLNHRKVINNCD